MITGIRCIEFHDNISVKYIMPPDRQVARQTDKQIDDLNGEIYIHDMCVCVCVYSVCIHIYALNGENPPYFVSETQ